MKDSVAEAPSYAQRAASYWGVDGLPDILRGLVLIALGVGGWLWRLHAPLAPGRGDGCVGVFIGLAIYAFAAERPVLGLWKSHITYPRTGYVQPPEMKWAIADPPTPISLRQEEPYSPSFFPISANRNGNTFWLRTGMQILVIFAVGMMSWGLLGRWRVPLMMPALAVALYLANRHFERPHPLGAAVALALTGLPFVWVTIPTPLQGPLPFFLLGPWLCALGIHTLIPYLRANRLPDTKETA